MVSRWWILPVLLVFFSGCIESGSLSLPAQDRRIDISSFGSQLKRLQISPSTSDMGVPLSSLPNHYQRSHEQGSYQEAFSLRGLPSTTILWTVHKDPFGRHFETLKSESPQSIVVVVDSRNITTEVTDKGELYRMAAHIGLYTFSAETRSPGEIDSSGIYGTHEDVVGELFLEGIRNALSFDLESFAD